LADCLGHVIASGSASLFVHDKQSTNVTELRPQQDLHGIAHSRQPLVVL
jgi:hypothetical protein